MSIAYGFKTALIAIIKGIRIEEWALLGIWAVYATLCLSTGTGFNFWYCMLRYLSYFAAYIFWLFAITRVVIPVMDSWSPKASLLKRIKFFGFRNNQGLKSLHETDLEFVRGAFLLFGSLSCYTNLKQRIPAINGTIGDPFFERLDNILFGPNFIPWVEQITRETKWIRELLSDTYMHGYFWMVVLLFLAYMRRDKLSMRWIFSSVAFTYLIALLITVLHPSYGLFFLEPDRFDWVRGGIKGSQSWLIKTYTTNMPLLESAQDIKAKRFMGIAAFPSLHIGHMVILIVIAIRMTPIYAIWMTGITIITFFATIAFGWHYSVDAIGGFLVAAITTVTLHRYIFKQSFLSALRKKKNEPIEA